MVGGGGGGGGVCVSIKMGGQRQRGHLRFDPNRRLPQGHSIEGLSAELLVRDT